MIVYASLIWCFCISVVLCAIPKLSEDLCIEKPSTTLIVVDNEQTEYVVVHNDKEDVKGTTRYVNKGGIKPTIKASMRAYGRRLANDFLPYNVSVVKQSGAGKANATTFLYQRKDKAEDQPYNIAFYGGFYYASPKGKDQQQLLGLNQVWVGCPSPMCLFGTIDAAFRDKDGIYITRGQYYWNIKGKKAPLSKNAKPLTDYAPIVTPIIDSAMVTGNFFFYFKDKRVYCIDKSTKKLCDKFAQLDTSNDLTEFFSAPAKEAFTPSECEAAFSFANDPSAKVALYGEASLSKLGIFKLAASKPVGKWYEVHKVINLPLLFQRKIDAMVAVDDKVWIFMGWINYKIPISAIEDPAEIDSKKGVSFYNFADPFGCDKGIYSGWVYDYDKYAEEMNEVVESDTHTFDDIKRRVDLLPEAPAMGSNLEARSVVGSIIQDEYKPGKKVPPSQIASKTSIASGVTPKAKEAKKTKAKGKKK
ncbi:hypothetical protein B4U80_12830 [Leptotrombidium deliense]|uniref:Uncharacterized protein n=1 Tax=Leptotrombidium deliense TaxID=299467 RepID=A0A443SK04_9ACAR|nr:hypothetical protein B4U80_12830 [Leptotrombidium deliense]